MFWHVGCGNPSVRPLSVGRNDRPTVSNGGIGPRSVNPAEFESIEPAARSSSSLRNLSGDVSAVEMCRLVRSRSAWALPGCAAVILLLSGCLLGTDQVRHTARGEKQSYYLTDLSTTNSLPQVRAQSPGSPVVGGVAGSGVNSDLPPAPDSPPMGIETNSSFPATVSPSSTSAGRLPQPTRSDSRSAPRSGGERGAPSGLSSISRNRFGNPATSASTTSPRNSSEIASGRNVDSGSNRMSPRLRNRIAESDGGNDDAQFSYPDIDIDPAQLYLERFGVEGEYDPFLFPWLVNLIFEDR